MTAYTTLSDTTLSQDKPLTQSTARAFRDNPLAIAEGDSSAPKIQPAAIDTDSILVSGSVRIWCDGFNDDDAMYYSADGDNFTTRTAICRASGTITVWADFSGGTDSPSCYVRKNGTTMATWSSIVASSYSTSFSVSVGDVIYLRSNTFGGDTLTLDRWEIRSNSTDHIGYVI